MKVLIINAILYTSETADIKRVNSIKDTMVYDLCLAFKALGAEPVLFAAEPYKPVKDESYPFEIIFAPCKLQKIFLPHRLPYMPGLKKYLKEHGDEFDLIISSEVFSLLSLIAARQEPGKTVIWHELAKHNAMMHQIPSKLWYNIIPRCFMKNVPVVARSKEAQEFISKYCSNVKDAIIDHGVNLEKFTAQTEKENYFIVSSQLIERKRIDRIIEVFAEFAKAHPDYKLYIFGEGECEAALKEKAEQLGIGGKTVFFGKVEHNTLKDYLSRARAMLVYTRQDNNMVSIVESIACATPIITTTVPYNASYIKANKLGIAKDEWDENDLNEICENSDFYVSRCLEYRAEVSTEKKVSQFLKAKQE
jgi:1,2-diacylglycerol 3-alpha-glucosyltransferase